MAEIFVFSKDCVWGNHEDARLYLIAWTNKRRTSDDLKKNGQEKIAVTN